MDMNAMQGKVVDIIANRLGVENEIITAEAHVVDDLGADSLDVVELVMALEEEFEESSHAGVGLFRGQLIGVGVVPTRACALAPGKLTA